MRLFVINLLLLASVAAGSPNVRQKRDLSTIKNWFSSAIFGRSLINIQPPPVFETESRYKLYRPSRYDDDMVKVLPRTPIYNEYLYPEVKPVHLNGFKDVADTKSHDNKLTAGKGLHNLLSKENSKGKPNNNMKNNSIDPVSPKHTVNKVATEKNKLVQKVEAKPPVITEGIQPYAERVQSKLPFVPKYSYIDMQNNRPELTYNGNFDYKPVETMEIQPELPICTKQGIDDVIMLGADPYRQAPVQEIYQYQPSPVVDFSYPRVEPNLYIQNPAFGGVNGRFAAVPDYRLQPQSFKDSPVRNNLRPMKRQPINPYPLPMNLHRSPQSDVVDISAPKTNNIPQTTEAQAYTNSGDKDKISQTLGPYPAQHMAHTNKELPDISKEKDPVEMMTTQIVPTNNNIANGNIPSYVYKYQTNPNTGKMLKVEKAPKTNVKPNGNYYNVHPPVNTVPNAKVNNDIRAYTVTVSPPSVSNSVTSSTTNKVTSHKDNPTVLPVGRGYSFQQRNSDVSSMTVRSRINGDSVDVSERGDIPE